MDPSLIAQYQMGMPGMMMGGGASMDPSVAAMMQQQYGAGYGQQVPGTLTSLLTF